jgi:hypothetical protein
MSAMAEQMTKLKERDTGTNFAGVIDHQNAVWQI